MYSADLAHRLTYLICAVNLFAVGIMEGASIAGGRLDRRKATPLTTTNITWQIPAVLTARQQREVLLRFGPVPDGTHTLPGTLWVRKHQRKPARET